ncbi:MAG: queuosine precursor transporter [Brevinema sp.]
MQYIIWITQLLLVYLSIIFLFYRWRREGLLLWAVLSVVLANIQVVKLISIFGLDATLGNILYVSSFFVTDAISEFYGKEEAKKAMYASIFASLIYLLCGQLAVSYQPLLFDTQGHEALSVLFRFSPRIVLASFICYWFSQTVDINIYHYMTEKKYLLWQKNIWSTFISQLADSVLFVFIAFWGVFESSLRDQLPIILQIALSTYLIKCLVNILDIPFLYILRSIKNNS